MQSLGVQATVLDVSMICHPNIEQPRTNPSDFSDFQARVIHDAKAMTKESATLNEADLIVCLFNEGTVTRYDYPVLRAIAKSGTPYLLLRFAAMPGINNFKGEVRNFGKRVRDIIKRFASIDLKNSLIARLPIRWLGLVPASFVTYGGKKSRQPKKLITADTQVIQVHSLDYEIFLKNKNEPVGETDTAVFIDQHIPHHKDFALFPNFSVGRAEDYYRGLNALFKRIEAEMNMEVIIAAHPNSNYDEMSDVFGDRKIIYGDTPRLIRQCKLAMTFSSLAINFAILYRKPLQILATRDFYNHPAGKRYLDPLSEEIGKPLVFLDNPETVDLSNSLHRDDGLYDAYVENYIKVPQTPEKPFWDIVLGEISQTLSP